MSKSAFGESRFRLSFYIFLTTITLYTIAMVLSDIEVAILFGVIGTISGWIVFFAQFLYTYISDKPKIKGKVLQVMYGIMSDPIIPSKSLSTFFLFLYLTNARENAVHLRNYELEIDFGKGYERFLIVRGIPDDMNFHFGSENGEILIPNFKKGLIYKQSKPIEFGVPFYGYLLFAGDIKYREKKAKRLRMTVTDVFDRKHIFTAKPEKDFVDIFYLQELFGIKMPVKNEAKNANLPLFPTSGNLISGNDIK